MGDARFERHYREVLEATDRAAAIRALPSEGVVMALAAASRKSDPLLANVLATEAMNRIYRSQTIAENLGEGVIALDADARVTFVNPAAVEALGYERDELLGADLHELVHRHEDGSRVPREGCAILAALRTGRLHYQHDHGDAFQRKDGSRFPVELTAAPVRRGGETVGVVIVLGDVTEERETAQALQRLAAIVEGSGDAIVAETPEGIITHWNPSAERLFGYSADEVVGRSVELLIPDDRRDEMDATRRVGQGAAPEAFETVRVARDGRRIPVSVALSPLRDGNGRIVGLSAIYRDMTHQRRAQEALRLSEERFRLVVRATRDIVWDWDAASDRLSWSETFCTAFGHSGEDVPTGFAAWSQLVHPSDRVRVLASIEAWLASPEESWSAEYALLCGDGTYAPVLDRGFVLRDAQGRPVRVVGTLMDISERRQAQEDAEAVHRALERRHRTMLPAIVGGAGAAVLLLVLLLLAAVIYPANVHDGVVLVGALLALALGAGVGAGVYRQRVRRTRPHHE